MTQSEAELEQALVNQLKSQGWNEVVISDADALKANLKVQLETFNKVQLSQDEFQRVLNHLEGGSVFEKAGKLRDRYNFTREDGELVSLRFLNSDEWCKNLYQVTTQVTQEGSYQNRYDVTLLINGLPLCQIELKRRGMELKKAFNQINRYQRYSYWAEGGLFEYVQIFVISNGVNTKYYANNRKQNFKQTFFWADRENNHYTALADFTEHFLEKCHLSKMIAKYIVLHQSDRILMVLRPYQYYAVEAIDERVKAGRNNGYIWHTTGSGKTLTSFKAAQLLIENPKVDKVLFVVDRADLDYQTTKEFNFFSEGSVDGTDNTKQLVKQLSGGTKLIVTTIQKLNTAITRDRYSADLEAVKDQRVVFIFDECHRSQFGDTHKNIVNFFSKAQMFGFTGTPILKDNKIGNRTTEDLFQKELHNYVITDAIGDENVLRFSIEYWGKLKRKDGSLIDEEVAGIDTKEFFESPERQEGIVDWIIENHSRKTHNKKFGAMFCVSSVDALISYYDFFQKKKEAGLHDLNVATIFTYAANEEDADANGMIADPNFTIDDPLSRDRLAQFVADYNQTFSVNETVKDGKGFYTYYNAIAKRMKSRDKEGFVSEKGIDILLVVNMFLTGFDAKSLNTLYVDKNLKYHGLIQAFSRTNRTFVQTKSHGNIVCFRNLRQKTDDAIALFSDREAEKTVLLEPYTEYLAQFEEAANLLKSIADTPKSVDEIKSEDDKLAFVKAFRAVLRLRNTLSSFAEFDPADLAIFPQELEDYKSKYLDIHDQAWKSEVNQKASIIHDVDFELELVRSDEINVAYILTLLSELKADLDADSPEAAKRRNAISDLLSSEVQLRSKRDLIEEFIEEYLSLLDGDADTAKEFQKFWLMKREEDLQKASEQLGLKLENLRALLLSQRATGKDPLSDQIVSSLNETPSILQRKKKVDEVLLEMKRIVEKYDTSIGDL